MNKQQIPSLSVIFLLTLVFGGYGSAVYFWLDESQSVDVALVEPSAIKESSASEEPSAIKESLASEKVSVSEEPLANKKPLADKKPLANVKPLPVKQTPTRTKQTVSIKPSVDVTPTSSTVTLTAEPSVNVIPTSPAVTLVTQSTTDLLPTSSIVTLAPVPVAESIPVNETAMLNADLSAVIVQKNPDVDLIAEPNFSTDITDRPSNEIIVEYVPSQNEFIEQPVAKRQVTQPLAKSNFSYQGDLATQAELRLQSNVTYDGRYVSIGYPMGDVPKNIGVCTDVVIRSFRGLGIDLQQRVHEDMKRNFRRYPNQWSLTKPDSNIDHRRVPNLMTYFKRSGAALKITSNPLDYYAGDVVAWDLGNGLTHIGIVSSYVSESTGNPLIVHNIGAGPEMNDALFKRKIIGHYKYGNRADSSQYASNNIR